MKEIIKYGIFGILTTILNIGTYAVLSQRFSINIAIANIIAWAVGVIFAFVTNKLIVFESKNTDKITVLREFQQFVSARLATGVVDEAIVVIGSIIVDGNIHQDTYNLAIKIASNILVIVLNYVFSKLFIFKTRNASK